MVDKHSFQDRWDLPRHPWLVPPGGFTAPTAAQKARLARLAKGAPEVFLRATGRPKSAPALKSHLLYIARQGALEVELKGGGTLTGRAEMRELAEEWAFAAEHERARRRDTPYALSLVLGLPPGSDPELVRRSSRALLEAEFTAHAYALALHTDRPHPHVHATLRWLGENGAHISSRKDVALAWRERFAEHVRAAGLEAEASPRWARGVVAARDSFVVRKIQERFLKGEGPIARAHEGALLRAATSVFSDDYRPTREELVAFQRQAAHREALKSLALSLTASRDAQDQELKTALDRFLSVMPAPASRRLLLMRQIHEARQRSPRRTLELER